MLTEATLPARIGGAVGAVLWLMTLLVFLSAERAFLHDAHDVAAVLMFLCIVGGAVDNAADTKRAPLLAIYLALALAMVAALAIISTVGLTTGWRYWTILVEVVVLALFVVFWLVQTAELWDQGIRSRPEGRRQPLPPSTWCLLRRFIRHLVSSREMTAATRRRHVAFPASNVAVGRRDRSVVVFEVVPNSGGDYIGCLVVGGCVVESFDQFGRCGRDAG
jgi:hypothetical protein